MTEPDNLLRALAQLPSEPPPAALSQRILAQGRARLVPAKLHPAWGIAVAASVVAYLGWALLYTGVL